MKLKPNQTRTYDGDGFKKRAACLCFKNEREEEVLLVSSSRHPDQWIVPGGGMEPEEEPCGAAVREVFEEASTLGRNMLKVIHLIEKIFYLSGTVHMKSTIVELAQQIFFFC
ncbi:Diphosphoinositol polyphosphate phosphohydrolase 1 [Oryzias melastigma]|uniref:Diphosphoinositol polyphosphate phosphohydrolase 1 n=1 Tax=Oryzias melastigma TaxID=30732 RepID=A0A834F209_ORYME|nr:Diphosphoinositol polyphosphate phosphohydrolase 1 [Oryzias melastigma]